MVDLNLMLIWPELFLSGCALLFLMIGAFWGNKSTDYVIWGSCLCLFIAGAHILGWESGGGDKLPSLGGALIFDSYSNVMKILILSGLCVSLLLSRVYLHQENIARFEYPVLVLLSGAGMLFMVSAHNFLSLYVALELQSLSLYVLAAFHRNSVRSAEAALKYFILGALSSGMLLFGISLVYGFSGTLDFVALQGIIRQEVMIPPGLTIGMVFILAALAFKISAAPFHMWTPDVYQGAPLSVTALFAIVPKVAAVALIVRLLYVPFENAAPQWAQILYFLALASLIIGAFAGIAQDNIKRLMAYSSIGNMGYVLIGIICATPAGLGAVMMFLIIYMAMTSGVFAALLFMRRDGQTVERIDDLAGLSKSAPMLAYALAALMFSMSGIPPLAGFFGKFFIFEAAVAQGHYTLAVLGILASVVSAYYYLRIIKVMFFDEPTAPFDRQPFAEKNVILIGSVAFVVLYILYPDSLLEMVVRSARSLF